MAKKIADGVAVRLTEREAVPADAKSQLFYPHYGGLTGTVTKLYADGTANVTVDLESLPKEIRTRHQTGTDAMRQKWLDGLSDEARNRLSGAEKKFALRYNILASVDDLTPLDTPPPVKLVQPSLEIEAAAEPSRKSSADLDAEEARHLAELAKKKKAP